MSKFKVTLKSRRKDRSLVYKAGKICLCRDILNDLFVIPWDTKEIVVTVCSEKMPVSYKVMNDNIPKFDFDADPDISLILSNGQRERFPLFDGVKAEFLKHVGIPCYVSVSY